MPVLTTVLQILLRTIQVLLCARLIRNWFPSEQLSGFFQFINICTDPLILPVRHILRRWKKLHLPFDISPLLIFLFIELLIFFIS